MPIPPEPLPAEAFSNASTLAAAVSELPQLTSGGGRPVVTAGDGGDGAVVGARRSGVRLRLELNYRSRQVRADTPSRSLLIGYAIRVGYVEPPGAPRTYAAVWMWEGGGSPRGAL